MSDDEKHAPAPATPPDTPPDDMPRVSSLTPATRAYSQRRLLNVASAALVVIALLALAIHWLPDVLPGQPNAQPTRVAQMHSTPTPPIHGAGWKRSGPDWAQSIAFSSTTELGYACGASETGDTPILFAVY